MIACIKTLIVLSLSMFATLTAKLSDWSILAIAEAHFKNCLLQVELVEDPMFKSFMHCKVSQLYTIYGYNAQPGV
jgi:hypothetical protein